MKTYKVYRVTLGLSDKFLPDMEFFVPARDYGGAENIALAAYGRPKGLRIVRIEETKSNPVK